MAIADHHVHALTRHGRATLITAAEVVQDAEAGQPAAAEVGEKPAPGQAPKKGLLDMLRPKQRDEQLLGSEILPLFVKLNDGEDVSAADILRKAVALAEVNNTEWNAEEQDFRDFYISEILEGLDVAKE